MTGCSPNPPFLPSRTCRDCSTAVISANCWTRGCRDAAGRLHLVCGGVEALRTDPVPILYLADGRRLDADLVVLAVGNHPPPPILPGDAAHSPCYCGDPWSPDVTAGTAPDAPVLIVGTGLTMVDTVLTLLDHGHHGPIVALSRRGLVPQRHVPAATAKLPPLPAYPKGMLALLRCLRADAAVCIAAGGAWQDALDRFRPFIQSSWMDATVQDRRRFLRHLRPWWDIHRHRIAGPVADRIDAARANGQLRILAGRIRTATDTPAGLAIHYQPRGGGPQRRLDVARVVNCTGPAINYQRITDPLVEHLLAQGLASPDPLDLGLAVTADGALLRADGTTGPIYALGSVTRGRFWDVTSVPDIRVQCDALAAHLARQLEPAGTRSLR